MRPVTDPELLRKLNGGAKKVTDPALLAELEGRPKMGGKPPLGFVAGEASKLAPWNQLSGLFPKMAGAGAEKMGAMGVPPKLSAGLMTPVAIAPDILGWGSAMPESGGSISAFKPKVPESRIPGVRAAEHLDIPLSRGEKTGGRFTSFLENWLEKSVLGSGPMNAFRGNQAAKLDAAKTGVQEALGTGEDLYSVGKKAQVGLAGREGAIKATKKGMFDAVPDTVRIEFPEAKKMAETLTQEQSKLFPGTHSPEVERWTRIVQDAETSTGKNVTGGPEVSGVTSKAPDKVIPGRTEIIEHPQEFNPAEPVQLGEGTPHYTVNETPGKTIPGKPIYGVKHSVGPETKFPQKDNYFAIKKLREQLGEAIGQAKQSGRLNDFRDLTRLKNALNLDIEAYAKSGKTPLDSMVADEFKNTYGKANAFSGAHKQLFLSPEARELAEAPPEKIVDIVFKKNNETAIKRFRALVGDEPFQLAKKRFTQDLMEAKNVPAELKKYKPGTLRAIFSAPELRQIQEYGDAQEILKSVSSMQGTAGSARSNTGNAQWGGLFAGLAELVRGEIPGAVAGIGQFVAPYPAAKAAVSNAFREGVNIPVPGAQKSAMAVREILKRMRNADSSPQ